MSWCLGWCLGWCLVWAGGGELSNELLVHARGGGGGGARTRAGRVMREWFGWSPRFKLTCHTSGAFEYRVAVRLCEGYQTDRQV